MDQTKHTTVSILEQQTAQTHHFDTYYPFEVHYYNTKHFAQTRKYGRVHHFDVETGVSTSFSEKKQKLVN